MLRYWTRIWHTCLWSDVVEGEWVREVVGDITASAKDAVVIEIAVVAEVRVANELRYNANVRPSY